MEPMELYFTVVVDPVMRPLLAKIKLDQPSKVFLVHFAHADSLSLLASLGNKKCVDEMTVTLDTRFDSNTYQYRSTLMYVWYKYSNVCTCMYNFPGGTGPVHRRVHGRPRGPRDP